MFDSGIYASELIEQVKSEADIAIPIPDASYILWLNALEQLLYTEVIQEQEKIELRGFNDDVIEIETKDMPLRFEDIYTIYSGTTQLIKSTLTSGVIFPDTYYKVDNNIGVNLSQKPSDVKIIYFAKPTLKTEENYTSETAKLPIEFVDLAKAKLRGEAYKIANEDNLGAKWLNDYNVLLETFKAWLSQKRPEFGM